MKSILHQYFHALLQMEVAQGCLRAWWDEVVAPSLALQQPCSANRDNGSHTKFPKEARKDHHEYSEKPQHKASALK